MNLILGGDMGAGLGGAGAGAGAGASAGGHNPQGGIRVT